MFKYVDICIIALQLMWPTLKAWLCISQSKWSEMIIVYNAMHTCALSTFLKFVIFYSGFFLIFGLQHARFCIGMYHV